MNGKTASATLCAGILFSLLALSCTPSRNSRVDTVLAPFFSPDGPGGTVMILQNDSVIYAKAFGLADLDHRTPVTLTTNFRLASVTKQFTAMAIMILADRGKLSLDQALTDFFPEFAPVGRTITLKHLLTHTSGILAYEDVIPDTTTVPLHDKDVLQLLAPLDSTYTKPGTTFRYSNSGYALLALVVEKVSGISFARFLKENIFLPLGMSNSVAYEPGVSEVPERAFGYSPDTSINTRFVRTDQSTTSSVLGDGGIYSSVSDMRKWAASFAAHPLVSPTTLRAVQSPAATIDSGKIWYGYGWFLDRIHDVPTIYHDGSTVGFRTAILRIPDRSLTIIMLFNRSDVDTESLRGALVQVYL